MFEENDPYMGLANDGHFVVPSASNLQGDITLDRLFRRRTLVEQLEQSRADLAETASGRQFDRYRGMTYDLLQSDKLRTALDNRLEPQPTRELYGDTLFGQACLTARRLVEAGSRVVTVFWDEYGVAGSAWGYALQPLSAHEGRTLPGLRSGLWYGLINDLDQRGLLDETLVVLTSEHGRTPKISMKVDGGGRDHWSRAYSSVVAGAGIVRGSIVGATDRQGGDPITRPISPKDLQATMYHLLGIDHHQLVHDALGRPLPLVDGHVIHEVLA